MENLEKNMGLIYSEKTTILLIHQQKSYSQCCVTPQGYLMMEMGDKRFMNRDISNLVKKRIDKMPAILSLADVYTEKNTSTDQHTLDVIGFAESFIHQLSQDLIFSRQESYQWLMNYLSQWWQSLTIPVDIAELLHFYKSSPLLKSNHDHQEGKGDGKSDRESIDKKLKILLFERDDRLLTDGDIKKCCRGQSFSDEQMHYIKECMVQYLLIEKFSQDCKKVFYWLSQCPLTSKPVLIALRLYFIIDNMAFYSIKTLLNAQNESIDKGKVYFFDGLHQGNYDVLLKRCHLDLSYQSLHQTYLKSDTEEPVFVYYQPGDSNRENPQDQTMIFRQISHLIRDQQCEELEASGF